MIESVNSLTAPTQSSTAGANTPGGAVDEGAEDPLSQIAQVLSSHLKSLQWIGSTVQEVEGKVGEAETKVREASGGKGGRTVSHTPNKSTAGYGSGSMTSSFGSGGREGSLTGSGAPLAGFGNMSLRGSEGPRARGFGLGSSTYRP